MSYYEKVVHGTNEFPIGIYCESQETGLDLYPHFHREFEFFAVTKGKGIVYIDNRVIYVSSLTDGKSTKISESLFDYLVEITFFKDSSAIQNCIFFENGYSAFSTLMDFIYNCMLDRKTILIN